MGRVTGGTKRKWRGSSGSEGTVGKGSQCKAKYGKRLEMKVSRGREWMTRKGK